MKDSREIAGGDYEHIGSASAALKEALKRIGVDPSIIRKAVIAAYEAEANVVIHARRGRMDIEIGPERIEVEVSDEGPGIEDIGLAMKEGYSTAPPEAREIGFGAGMGLPNIKASADRFVLESVPGRGTRLRFCVFLKPRDVGVRGRHSILPLPGKCTGCLDCVRLCPTQAMRVYDCVPRIIEDLCVDCGACIGACGRGAMDVVGGEEEVPTPSHGEAVVAAASLTAQFGRRADASRVVFGLRACGFADLYAIEEWECALRSAVEEYAKAEGPGAAVISPVCPAVVNLIACRFPSLLKRIAPFLSPIEAAAAELSGRKATFAFLCPSQRTALAAAATGGRIEMVSMRSVIRRLAPLMASSPRGAGGSPEGRFGCVHPASGDAGGSWRLAGIMRITGMKHAMAFLSAMEDGAINPVAAAAVEIYACDGGCYGAPLLAADPFVAVWIERTTGGNAAGSMTAGPGPARKAARLASPPAPRDGMRLDRNMAKAIEKLSTLDALARSLPGDDCGLCGAPSCYCMAEDVVMGRIPAERCAKRKSAGGHRDRASRPPERKADPNGGGRTL